MKQVKARVEINLGVFTDEEDGTKERLMAFMDSIQERISLPFKTLEITVTDIDTNLITANYCFGDAE